MNDASPTSARERLADPLLTLRGILDTLRAAEEQLAHMPVVRMGIAANVTVDLAAVYLRRHAVLENIRLEVTIGSYDDLLGDMDRFAAADTSTVLLLELFDNLLPAFEAQLATMDLATVEAKRADYRARLRLVLERGRNLPQILIARFHPTFGGEGAAVASHRLAATIHDFNRALEEVVADFPNASVIDLSPAIAVLGTRNAFDLRYYFRNKAPYSLALLDALGRLVTTTTRAYGTCFCKALVLDCDNTLWGGVLGEAGEGGIKLDPFEYPGNVYWRVQQELAGLQSRGVLICLASKNNPEDVDKVLASHPHMVLRDSKLTIKKINWESKVVNLRSIAAELNIGLDSMVFVDDSAFECELARSQLPMVRTHQVPAAIADYPALIEEIMALFPTSGDPADKTGQYRARAEAIQDQARFESEDEYLDSLGINVTFRHNARDRIPRISELTMKSNQFNLTTRRYTEGQLFALMDDRNAAVLSFEVSDRFGDAGLTAVAILQFSDNAAVVDSLLMSCRIIGRGIEAAVWNCLLQTASERGVRSMEAEYIPTGKNAQVADYYDRMGLIRLDAPGTTRRYRSQIDTLANTTPRWIEVNLGQ